jgi:hypothetical protein
MNDWIPESASCDAKEDRDEEVEDAVLPAVLPVVPSAIKNHQCYHCKMNFSSNPSLSYHLANRVCTRDLHTQRAGAMQRVYAPVSNAVADARDAVGFNITLQALVERESAMVHPSSKPVIIKQGRRITWQNAELKALFFRLLLPYCQSAKVNWRKYFSPGYKVVPGRNPDFPASVATEIAQVGFNFILSFILPALTSALINYA